MFWDNLVTAIKRAKVKTCIHKNYYFNQQCFKKKQSLKININSYNNQSKKLKIITLKAKIILLIN